MAKPLTSWLVPSFLQHKLCLLVSGRCFHVSLTKFQDKFASLQQVYSPNSLNKFQIIILYRHVFNKISTEFLRYFACFCELSRILRIYLIFGLHDLAKIQKLCSCNSLLSPQSYWHQSSPNIDIIHTSSRENFNEN